MKKQTTKLHFTGEDLRNESVKKAAEKAEAETRKHRPRLLRDEEVPVRV